MGSLKRLIKRIFNFFDTESQTTPFEEYILSKSPQSIYDVDYWTRQYDRNKR